VEPIGAGVDFLQFCPRDTRLRLRLLRLFKSTMATSQNPPAKRIKREEYRAALQAQQGSADDGSVIKMPQKKFFRQRAHANPFSDHRLE
jgi:hypothetical protein